MNNNNLNRKLNFNNQQTNQYISTEELESQEKKNLNDRGLRFLHVNIKSFNKNISLLKELMSKCNIFPDTIGICETKLNNKITGI